MLNILCGGGIFCKIFNVVDCKCLKFVVSELELFKGVGLIICMVGVKWIKVEICCDVDYLMCLWSNIREVMFKVVVFFFIYEEGNLVKCVICDFYDKEIDLVLVEGEVVYKEVKGFMCMFMLSYVKKV